MYIKRSIEETVLKLSDEFPVVVLTGARQVGKSTMLQIIKKEGMNYVTLDDLDARKLAIEDPKYFLSEYRYPIIIDEIQYAPDLLSYIKIIVDEKRLEALKNNTKIETLFWLTGSQQFNLMKDVTESLAGRVGVLNLYSLSYNEITNVDNGLFIPKIELLKNKNVQVNRKNMLDDNSIESNESNDVFFRIFRGGMPAVVTDIAGRNNFYQSYITTYIERDVRQLLNVGNILEFYNFMQYIAVRTAQELNYATIANELGLDLKTIKRWIGILETSGIVYILKPYYSNVSNRLIKTPKLYFMDTGLCSYLAKYQSPETLEAGALSGAIFETYVISEIIKNYSNKGLNPSECFYYYRDKDNKEIDLVYLENDVLYPIEIKKGISPNNPDKNFDVLKKYSDKVETGIVICMTNKLQPINRNCYLCPVEYI